MTVASSEAARALAQVRWGPREPVNCAECGRSVPAESRYRDYCSSRCQVRAFRRRRRNESRPGEMG